VEAADPRLGSRTQSLHDGVRGKDPGVGNEPVTQKPRQSIFDDEHGFPSE
jgi:hypothetical protein